MSLLTRMVGVALLSGALLLPTASFAQSQTGMSGLPGADDFSIPGGGDGGAMMMDYNSTLDANYG